MMWASIIWGGNSGEEMVWAFIIWGGVMERKWFGPPLVGGGEIMDGKWFGSPLFIWAGAGGGGPWPSLQFLTPSQLLGSSLILLHDGEATLENLNLAFSAHASDVRGPM